MRRLVFLLALLLAAPLVAQPRKIGTGARLVGTPVGYATMTAPSGCVAGSVALFLGSPVLMGCDAGLTYDAATDALTIAAAGALKLGTDTGLSRLNPAVLAVGNGTAGDTSGTVATTNVLGPGGTLNLGAAASATPVNQTLQAQGGAGTNIPGADLTIQSGAGTGSGTASKLIFKTPTSGGSGSGAQSQSTRFEVDSDYGIRYFTLPFPYATDTISLGYSSLAWSELQVTRGVFGSKSKVLTDASATDFATIALDDGAMTGGEIIYRVTATISGQKQVLAGRVRYSAIRDNTDYDCDISEVGAQTNSQKSGTLTGAITCAAAAGVLTFSANFDSSLTAPTVTLRYRFDSTDAATSITPL